MSEWLVLGSVLRRAELADVVEAIDPDARAVFVGDADTLRRTVAASVPGELGVVVGPVGQGVSDVNVAAAIVRDGCARSVILACDGASGSLRSRAARAGVDLVIDLTEQVGEGSAAGREAQNEDRQSKPGVAAAPLPVPKAEAVSVGPEPSPTESRPSELGRRVDVPSAVEERDRRGAVFVFCSGRGGVGKTSVAAVASVVAAGWGLKACLLDLDLSCGNAYSLFGLAHGSDLTRVSEPGEPMERVVSRLALAAAPGVSVLGPCELPESGELVAPRAGELIEAVAASCDLVVVDTSATFTDAVAQAAQVADRLVLVSDGRAGSIAALSRLGGLAVRLGVARTRIVRLENRADARSRREHVFGRAEVGLEVARVFKTYEGGVEVTELLGAGQVVDLVETGGAFPESVATLVAQLLQELGRLPDCEEARRAAEVREQHSWRGLLGLRREAR